MKRKLVLTPKFKRAFSSFVHRNRRLQQEIEKVLEQMEEDIFSISLNTHKLSGTLEGLRACSCGYDCRIIFSLENELIVLLDIGRHDEVY